MRKDVTRKKNESHKLIGEKQERWKVKRKKVQCAKKIQWTEQNQRRKKEKKQKYTAVTEKQNE